MRLLSTSARPAALSALMLSVIVLTCAPRVTCAQSSEDAHAVGPLRAAPALDARLQLDPPMRRATRTIRTGGLLLGLGAASTITSAILWTRHRELNCPFFMYNERSWMRGPGPLTGMIVGAALMATGSIALAIGVHRTRRQAISIGVGSASFALSF